MSLYGAWETFARFYIEEYSPLAEVDDGLRIDDLPGPLRNSQVRLGVYAGLVRARELRWPRIVSNDITKIRNQVAHDSEVPTSKDVARVGRAVQEAIVDGLGLSAAPAYPELVGTASDPSHLYASMLAGEVALEKFRRDAEDLVRDSAGGAQLRGREGGRSALTALGLRKSFATVDIEASARRSAMLELGHELLPDP
jgi:hypothetical protein